MITVSEMQLNGLPVLEVVDAKMATAKLPLIIFYHGWTNCKEVVLTQGYELAKNGYRVVLPDALYHGLRAKGKAADHVLDFWKIVLNSVAELPRLLGFYQKLDLIKEQKIGVGGFSMGGITTCMLMTAYPQLNCGVVLSGTPQPVNFAKQLLHGLPMDETLSPDFIEKQLEDLARFDLSLHPESIAGRALHFSHGDADQLVPCEFTQGFYSTNAKRSFARQLSLNVITGGQHKLSYAVTQEMVQHFNDQFK